MEQAKKGNQRKWQNLGKGHSNQLNFGGQNDELWCPGGEIKFIARMVEQSMEFAEQCLWFTSLVSKKENLKPLNKILNKAKVADFEVVEMAQGQKTSRFIAWTYVKKSRRSPLSTRASKQSGWQSVRTGNHIPSLLNESINI